MTVYAVMLAATTAPRPTATKTACAVTPTALPSTESSASRRPTVRARPIVKSRLGPGTWMKSALATRKASHWWVGGTRPVWGSSPPRARGLRVGKDEPMGAGHSHGSHRAGGDADLVVA